MVGAACLLGATAAFAEIPIADPMRIRGQDNTVYAVIVDCPQPDAGSGPEAATFGGAEEGRIGNERCGACLIDANWGTHLLYPQELMISGKLLDENDQPRAKTMVRFFLPNGWSVKTRTLDDGYFRVMLGATAERKSNEPIKVDVGVRRLKRSKEIPYYAMYILPEHFKPCPPEKPRRSGAPGSANGKGRPKAKTKEPAP
jgi:hypothetical protein